MLMMRSYPSSLLQTVRQSAGDGKVRGSLPFTAPLQYSAQNLRVE